MNGIFLGRLFLLHYLFTHYRWISVLITGRNVGIALGAFGSFSVFFLLEFYPLNPFDFLLLLNDLLDVEHLPVESVVIEMGFYLCLSALYLIDKSTHDLLLNPPVQHFYLA